MIYYCKVPFNLVNGVALRYLVTLFKESKMNARFPEVRINLENFIGNGTALITAVSEELRSRGCPSDIINEFRSDAESGDLANLIRVVREFVTVTNIDE